MGPLIGTGAIPAPFGSDHQTGRVGIQRFGNQFLVYIGPVGIGSVDEIDVEFDGASQNR